MFELVGGSALLHIRKVGHSGRIKLIKKPLPLPSYNPNKLCVENMCLKRLLLKIQHLVSACCMLTTILGVQKETILQMRKLAQGKKKKLIHAVSKSLQ